MRSYLHFLGSTILLLVVIAFSTTTYSQTAELSYQVEPYVLESGVYNGNGVYGSVPVKVFSATVQLHNIPWLQLHFSDANLGNESYVLIKSKDSDSGQRLDAISIEQWNYFSAFFNGEQVDIELFVGAMDQNIYINLAEVLAGDWDPSNPFYSICGPSDDRIPSNHPATGRLLNVGCTAWIIPNGKIVSAGHCLANAGSVNVLQFNVPPSLPGGGLQHPPPEHQYPADASSRVYVNGGVGNDWGVFEVFPNSITGLMPREAQSAYFTLVQDLGPDSIRITGYGVDSGTANQTQQTHVGPNWGSSGTTMRYRTDTQGGNSGSPIIDELTGYSTGVHSHGGCTSSGGNNNGTSFFHVDFWAAVDSGIIPVELTSFTVNSFDDYAELQWITATETNNAGFAIERTSNQTSEWSEIAFVDGNGTSAHSNVYKYIDEELTVGTYTYRLKQIDYDGSYSYSSEVEAVISAPDNFALYQNYPNPFNPSTTIKFNIPSDAQVQLNVFNTLGEKVAELFNGTLKGGYHEFVFDASTLTSGIYFYRLESDEFADSKKMILIK